MEEISKTCTKCGEIKSLGSYHNNSSTKDGKFSRCKICVNEANKARAKEKYQGLTKEEKKEIYLKRKNYVIEYKKKNPEKIKAHQAKFNENNPGRTNAIKKKWADKNPLNGLERSARYRARKRGATVEKVDYSRVLERDNMQCYICEEVVNEGDVDIDHILPISKGGHHAYHNAAVTHYWCNRKKSAKLPHELEPDIAQRVINKLEELG